jgi:hypothetical protein
MDRRVTPGDDDGRGQWQLDCSALATRVLISGNSSGQVLRGAGRRERREEGTARGETLKSLDGFRSPATNTA